MIMDHVGYAKREWELVGHYVREWELRVAGWWPGCGEWERWVARLQELELLVKHS